MNLLLEISLEHSWHDVQCQNHDDPIDLLDLSATPAMACRMLGSLAEAEDAVQNAWLRLRRSAAEEIDNLGGWLTTVVARECLHVLRSRRLGREASFDALLQVLDPDVLLRTDFGAGRPPTVVRGAAAVARQAHAPRGGRLCLVLVNGTIGAVTTQDGRPYAILAFTVAGDRTVRIDVLRDPDRVHRLAAAVLARMG